MTTYDWQTERAKIVAAFAGEQPHDQTEQSVLDVFRHSPLLVLEQAQAVAAELKAGQVRSGWAVLRKRLVTAEQRQAQVSDAPDRERRLAQAEHWLRNAGFHFDRWQDVEDELFGERGRLRSWPELKERLRIEWQSLQPQDDLMEVEL